MKCPHCQKEFNAGKVMGSAKTPAKTAAAKKRGERMKLAFLNLRKMEEGEPVKWIQGKPRSEMSHEFKTALLRDNPDLAIPPKPTTLEGKKAAALAALISTRSQMGRGDYSEDSPDLSNVPHAPFDFEQEGETYRVRGERNGLGLYWLGEDGEQRKRSLEPGELEKLWAKRIIK